MENAIEIIFFPLKINRVFDCINFLFLRIIELNQATFEYWSMPVNFLVKKLEKIFRKERGRRYPGEESWREACTTCNFVKIFFEIQKYISGETERTRFWVEARKLLRFHTREARLSSFLLLTKAFYVSLTEVDFRLCFAHRIPMRRYFFCTFICTWF